MKLKFRVSEFEEYTLVHFDLNEPITPDELREIKAPRVNAAKGVILSGRGPVWLFCFLAHAYHPTKFVATYDPRLGGVIVESHDPTYRVGDVLNVVIEE